MKRGEQLSITERAAGYGIAIITFLIMLALSGLVSLNIWNLNPNIWKYMIYVGWLGNLSIIIFAISHWLIKYKINTIFSSELFRLSVFLNLAGLIFSFNIFSPSQSNLEIIITGKYAQGEITNLESVVLPNQKGNSPRYFADFLFLPANGSTTINSKSNVSKTWYSQHQIGDQITIRYVPDNPYNNFIEGANNPMGDIEASMVSSLIPSVATIILLTFTLRLEDIKRFFKGVKIYD